MPIQGDAGEEIQDGPLDFLIELMEFLEEVLEELHRLGATVIGGVLLKGLSQLGKDQPLNENGARLLKDFQKCCQIATIIIIREN